MRHCGCTAIMTLTLALQTSRTVAASMVEDDIISIARRAVTRVQGAMDPTNSSIYKNFGNWTYEGAVITRGLWELQSQLPELDLEPFLHSHLDSFLDSPDEFGYKILHNESLIYNLTNGIHPWGYTIGDIIGLYPVAYADRIKYASSSGSHPAGDDLYVIEQVVEQFIYGYPWRLEDGTVSRNTTWPAQGLPDPKGAGVQVDDMYMGNSLLISLALLTKDTRHAHEAARQLLQFSQYLQDENGLYHHGYNHYTGDQSCCYWGRGNGWAFMAYTELLEAWHQLGLDETDPDTLFELWSAYTAQYNGLLAVQASNGLWSNVLTNNSTFQETSAAAMFLLGISTGYRNGWLPGLSDDVLTNINAIWSALQLNILEDGTIVNIIGGTGIKDNEDGYTPRNTDYNNAGPGVGAVLRATAEMARLKKFLLTKKF